MKKIHEYSPEGHLIKEFWTAKEEYAYQSTRCPVGIKQAEDKMRAIVGKLIDLGVFDRGGRMPRIDELDSTPVKTDANATAVMRINV